MIPTKHIVQAIRLIRGQKVLLDADLAALYGVETKRFNEQVKRNRARFPADFIVSLIDIRTLHGSICCWHCCILGGWKLKKGSNSFRLMLQGLQSGTKAFL